MPLSFSTRKRPEGSTGTVGVARVSKVIVGLDWTRARCKGRGARAARAKSRQGFGSEGLGERAVVIHALGETIA